MHPELSLDPETLRERDPEERDPARALTDTKTRARGAPRVRLALRYHESAIVLPTVPPVHSKRSFVHVFSSKDHEVEFEGGGGVTIPRSTRKA